MYPKVTLLSIFIVFSLIKNGFAASGAGVPDSVSAYDSTKYHFHKGMACFDRLEYEAALHHLECAEQFFTHADRQSPFLWAVLCRYLGETHARMGTGGHSLRYYRRALEYMRTSAQEEDAVYYHILTALGKLYNEQYDYLQSEKYFTEALHLTETRPSLRGDLPYAKMHLGIVFYYKKQHDMADRLFGEALEALLQQKPVDLHSLADLYDNMAANFREQDLPDSSLHYLQLELGIRHHLPDAPSYLVAKLYSDLGESYHMSGQNDRAEFYFVRAIDLAKRVPGPVNLFVHYYMKYVRYLRAQHRLSESLACLEEAFEMVLIDRGHEVIAAEPVAYILMLAEKGTICRELFEQTGDSIALRSAFKAFAGAHRRIRGHYLQSSRHQIHGHQTDVFYPVFESYLHLLCTYGMDFSAVKKTRLERAFQLMEQSKNIRLLENTRVRQADQIAGIPDSVIRVRKQLLGKIAEAREALIAPTGNQNRRALQTALNRVEDRYRLFVKSLYQNFPDYYRLIHDGRSVSLDDLQKELLHSGDVYLEYFLGNERCFLLWASRDRAELISLGSADSVRTGIQNFDSLLQLFPKLGDGPEERASYNRSLAGTAAKLFREIVPKTDVAGTGRLIVVPDGYIHLLPFEALVIDTVSPNSPYCQWPFLIRSTRISYQYSAALWDEMMENTASEEANHVLFGVDFEEKYLVHPDGTEDSFRLHPLPNSIKEATTLARLMNGTVITGKDATKRKFLSRAARSDILHLSTHTVLNDRFPNRSFLVFSRDSSGMDSNCLHLDELFRADIPARLITLNTCSTYRGPYAPGQGMVSLSKGFAHAGAQSIIATRWPLPDRPARTMITKIYSQLRKGNEKDEAMHRAAISFMDRCDPRTAHPYYWSNYLLIGNTTVLFQKEQADVWYFLVAACLLLMTVITVKRYVRKEVA